MLLNRSRRDHKSFSCVTEAAIPTKCRKKLILISNYCCVSRKSTVRNEYCNLNVHGSSFGGQF
jgi:hypothetical protein